jgi:D-sedoheptulose 7-phosphate isomerase
MMTTNWRQGVEELRTLLLGLSLRNANGRELAIDTGFDRWRDAVIAVRRNGGTVFLVGNGASASMASHIAADLAKNARVHTQCFTDLSLLTAISNDMGYERVFAQPLRSHARAGDILVAISSSGRSPNVLAVADVAQEMALAVITLSAMSPDNPLRSKGCLNAYVAATTYGSAETCHAAILHHMMDMVEAQTEPLAPSAPAELKTGHYSLSTHL